MYKVDKILQKKKEKRRIFYLVKWKGFEEKEATWEPKRNLECVKSMLEEFDAENEKNSQQDKKKERSMSPEKEKDKSIDLQKQHVNKRQSRRGKKPKAIIDKDSEKKSKRVEEKEDERKKDQRQKSSESLTSALEKEEKIRIVGMKNEKKTFTFYVVIEGKGEWVERQFLIKNYADELCQFYEKRIVFNDDD